MNLQPSLRLVALIVLALLSSPVQARLTQKEAAVVASAPTLGARVHADRLFLEAMTGRTVTFGAVIGDRPTVLLLVDYTCRNVCDPMLAMTVAALRSTGVRLGDDANLIVIGIDPRDDAAAARAFLAKSPEILPDAGVSALVGDEAAIRALTTDLNYKLAYDPETDGFVHQAAAMLLTPDGRLARLLSPLTLNGRDLRLSLIETGAGRIGTLQDRLLLLCYGFDAAKGVYTPVIRNILAAAAALTVLLIASGILVLSRRGQRA